MRKPSLLRNLTAFLALAMSAGAYAQATKNDDTMQLPIWNQASGKVEAVLLLEPADQASVGVRRRFSEGALDAAFGLGAGDSLGLLCDRKNGISGTLGNLANHCLLASMGDESPDNNNRRINATTGFSRNGGRVGLTLGSSQESLPAWLSPARGKVEQHDVTIYGEKSIGREGFVTIGGTVAKARIVSAADVPELADRWNTRSLSIGGGYGPFSGNIIGRVIDVPGQGQQWQGLGLGFTWRTPWSGQLTVGADNVVTRGKNPFAAPATSEEQGTVPYVRYEQDL
jgi:hypothetical protein